ncbi:MAG: penicillin-binding transpeptidase domain-containing protein, partial [Lysinibacillus sp.]
MLLFGRFFQLQSTGEANGYDLQAYAAEQYARERVLEADRGKILDRSGEVIAEDTVSFKVVAVLDETLSKNTKRPQHVVDKKKTAQLLAPILNLTEEEIYERLNYDKKQVEFGAKGKNLSFETKNAIDELQLPGINFETEKKRHYPNGSFASHVIGFIAADLDKDNNPTGTVSGKMGIELTYDDVLKGKNGIFHYQRDNFGYLLANGKEMIEPAQDGFEVHLTLDKTIQSFLDDAMTRVDEAYNPEAMMAIVADPKTGEVLAMSQRPTFNPDNRSGLTDTTWLNTTVEDVLEPGSTVKTFTIAAAIETGNWHPNAK